LWEVNDLFEYWQEYPPTHVLAGAFFGYKGSRSRQRIAAGSGQFGELVDTITSFGGTAKKTLPAVYTSAAKNPL